MPSAPPCQDGGAALHPTAQIQHPPGLRERKLIEQAAVSATLRDLGVTRREADNLALVAAGLANATIAEQLYVSVRTVESHVSSLLAKLDARNRTELTARHLELQRNEVDQHRSDL